MRIRRSLPIIFAVLLIVAASALVVVLRKHAPPEPARLLPGADGFIYVNLQWIRRANIMGELPPVPHDAEYGQFIEATDFQFERDLNEAAIAIHYPATPPGTTPDRTQTRFSEVFVGKIHGERLAAYLQKISSSVESYHSLDIYNIPIEERTLRVAILGVDTVAASNHPDPQVIRGIVDRSRKLASPFGGPALLRQYYKHVPLASLAWGILRVEPQSGPHVSSLAFLFDKPAVVLTSVRYLAAVHFRAVAFTASEADAKHVTEQLTAFFNLFHAAESTVGTPGPDPDVKAFFSSLKLDQQKDRAILTATVPLGFIRKMLSEVPAAVAPQPTSQQNPAPAPPESKGKSRKK